jgi:selenocysteine-specific elongation factor
MAIVATAGHIDHGKTTLVKALTGVDTDRLPEEIARGISIDLGFAYWREPGGALLGFVDVPGHERFVRNMLAGVCGVDLALLVIAADDGVMPQTREHLGILDLLGIGRGLVAITKTDRVDAARRAQVAREARALLAGTALAAAPVCAVSAATGEGIADLRHRLTQAAREPRPAATQGRRFRFAVDRAFTVTGSGTVVTGTVFAGSIRAGGRLTVSPAGHEVRVRAIHKDGVQADRADAGERCALNLAGIELGRVRRGDWVLDARLHAPTSRLDVQLRVLASEVRALHHWTPVHLHLGTHGVTARVTMRHGGTIAPGGQGMARLITDQPIGALHGDRFILRDHSARRTLGGGVVLDAFPPPRWLQPDHRERHLHAFAQATASQALVALADCTPGGADATAFARNFNLDDEALMQLIVQAGLALIGTGAQARVVARQQAHAMRASRMPIVAPEIPEHTRLWQLALPVLRDAGRAGMTVPQLAAAIAAKEAVLGDMLHRRSKAGDAVRVSDARFYLRSTMEGFIEAARQVAVDAPDGRFTAAMFRDQAGVGRQLAIQVLEAMDRLGVTRRVADARVLCAQAVPHSNDAQRCPMP